MNSRLKRLAFVTYFAWEFDIQFARAKMRKKYLILSVVLVATIVFLIFQIVSYTRTKEATNKFHELTSTAEFLKVKIPPTDEVVLEISNNERIREIIEMFSIKPTRIACGCFGELSFELYNEDKLILDFSLHHGETIRCYKLWEYDVKLTTKSQKRIAKWKQQLPIFEPLSDFHVFISEPNNEI